MIDTTLDYLMSNPGGLQKEVSRIIQQELGVPEQHELLGTIKPRETASSKALRKLVTDAIDSMKQAVEKSQVEASLNKEDSSTYDDFDDEAIPLRRAAKMLNLAVQTLYGKTSRREIPFYKKGKFIYFKKSELLDWIEEGRRKSNNQISQEAALYSKRKK